MEKNCTNRLEQVISALQNEKKPKDIKNTDKNFQQTAFFARFCKIASSKPILSTRADQNTRSLILKYHRKSQHGRFSFWPFSFSPRFIFSGFAILFLGLITFAIIQQWNKGDGSPIVRDQTNKKLKNGNGTKNVPGANEQNQNSSKENEQSPVKPSQPSEPADRGEKPNEPQTKQNTESGENQNLFPEKPSSPPPESQSVNIASLLPDLRKQQSDFESLLTLLDQEITDENKNSDIVFTSLLTDFDEFQQGL